MGQQIQIDFNVPATMRDGTILRANVLSPAEDGSYPVALCRTPYNKDQGFSNPILDAVRLTRAGYIVVIQDVRGRGASDGEWLPFKHEALDGYDSVEWAARLPGSNSNVGMFGASYVGFTQWVTAVQAPPHLKAIVPSVTWADASDGLLWRGGAFELGLIGYLLTYGFGFDSVQRLRAGGKQELQTLAACIDDLPNNPLCYVETIKDLNLGNDFLNKLVAEESPAFCSPFVTQEDYRKVVVPSYSVGGWYDIFAQGTLKNFSAVSSAGQSKLLMGPWSHINFDQVVGEQDFGLRASLNTIDMEADLTTITQQWFDYWLKGIDNGVMDEPSVKLFIMGENTWRDEHEWPLARTKDTPFYLRRDGLLSEEVPGDEPSDHYTYDPANPTPTVGGAIHMHPVFGAGVIDQRPLAARDDVLVYTSDVLREAVEVTGPIVAKLWVASDAPETDFMVRLLDVFPDGFSKNLTDGVIRTRHHAVLQPAEPCAVTIDLWATANVFKARHRICIQIASASFPRWNRNPNSGEPFEQETFTRPARQTVLHNSAHPSHIVLPLILS